MRATLAGLPRPARLMLGLFSAGAFLFVGRVLLEEQPVIGWILIALGALRLSMWLRQATSIAAARAEELAEEAASDAVVDTGAHELPDAD